MTTHVSPAWLPDAALAPVGAATVLLLAPGLDDDPVLGTVAAPTGARAASGS
ncbi:hypothetical protein GTQ99_21535, partial [Kineococcus sp. T13]|nr:hypothetical protein [Kineococcus vitellinus]